jgi:hypothetical protein
MIQPRFVQGVNAPNSDRWLMSHDSSKFRLIMKILLPNSQPLLQLMFWSMRLGKKSLHGFLQKPLLSIYKRANVSGTTFILSLLPALEKTWVVFGGGASCKALSKKKKKREHELQKRRPYVPEAWSLLP